MQSPIYVTPVGLVTCEVCGHEWSARITAEPTSDDEMVAGEKRISCPNCGVSVQNADWGS